MSFLGVGTLISPTPLHSLRSVVVLRKSKGVEWQMILNSSISHLCFIFSAKYDFLLEQMNSIEDRHFWNEDNYFGEWWSKKPFLMFLNDQ